MIPLLYSGADISYIGALSDAITCVKAKQDEGHTYELTLTYPVEGILADKLVCKNIIKASNTDDVPPYDIDMFVIYKTSQSGHIVTVTATELVRFLIAHTIVRTTEIDEGTSDLMNSVFETSAPIWNPHPSALALDSTIDRGTTGTDRFLYPQGAIPLMDLITGKANSYTDIYNKKFDTRMYIVGGTNQLTGDILVNNNNAVNRNNYLAYGKEIKNYTLTYDMSPLLSHVTPYWRTQQHVPSFDPDDATVRDTFVIGAAASNPDAHDGFFVHICGSYDCTDEFENQPTSAQMQKRAQKYLNQHNKIAERIDIELAPGVNKDIRLNEILNIIIPGYAKPIQARVNSFEYDVIKEQYNRIDLGEPRKSFARSIYEDTSRTKISQ